MSVRVATFQEQYGGMSTDKRLGPKASFAYSQGFDFRKSPSQMSVLPGLTREDDGVVKDLILKEVMDNSGVIYGYGNQGYFYKRTPEGVWSVQGKLSTGAGGVDYRQDADSIYLTSAKTASLYNQVTTDPQMFPDYYASSYSTYNNTENMGFNVSAYQAGSAKSTTLSNTIIENNTNKRFFQTDIEPLVKVSVFVNDKGTGDWTLTLHDGLDDVLGVKTISNASITNNTWLDFYFTAATNQQVRVYPAPNARTYHVHVTSSNSTGSISSSATNDMSTADLQVWADRFVVTNNQLHPMIRFQQFEAIGNGNYLSIWEPITDVPTNSEWQRHRLTFPQEYEVCGLAVQNEFLVIAAEKTTTSNTSTPQQGVLFFWDGTSPTYNYFVEIPEGSPYSLTTYKNIAYYVAGGAWYAITSASTQPVKIRTLPGSDSEFSGLNTTASSDTTPSGTDVITSTSTWTAPTGVGVVYVEAWGGGGAGGGATITNQGASGGGGGAYAASYIPVTPGIGYGVTVGDVALGTTGNGADGNNSSFESTVIAVGGKGGVNTGPISPGGAGGLGSDSTGDVTYDGGIGGDGYNPSGGGGGAGAGRDADGNDGSPAATSGPPIGRGGAGGAGSSGGGSGGDGIGSTGNGYAGTAPGGAGGGASTLTGTDVNGGNGARGEVHITYGGKQPTLTLVDNFSGSGSTPDPDKWVSFGNYSQGSGFLSLTSSTSISFNGIESVERYDLTGSSMQSRLVDAGNQSLVSLEVYPVLGQIDANNQIFWYVNQNSIKAYTKVAGVNTILDSIAYDANTFQYLRIRENDGVIYFDYSPNGVTWSNFTSTSVPFGITMLTQVVTIDNYTPEATTTTVIIDDYNVIVASDYAVGYPDMMTVRRGVLMLGYPAITTNTNTNYGVYSWGSIDKNYPDSFGYSYVLSTGSKNFNDTNNLQIGMVKSFGDTMHVSWRDDLVSGTPRYGVDVVDNSSFPAPVAIWESLVITNNYTAKQKLGVFIESYYNIPVGAAVRLAYKIDQGDWVSDSHVYTATDLWQGQTGYVRFNVADNNGGRFRELQGRITVTCEDNTQQPPEVYEINVAYDNLSQEVVM